MRTPRFVLPLMSLSRLILSGLLLFSLCMANALHIAAATSGMASYALKAGKILKSDSATSNTFSSTTKGEALALTLDGGTDIVWVDDAVPSGATTTGDYSWNWMSASPAPFSGTLAHQSTIAAGMHQHLFSGATAKLQINEGESLFAYVYIDPENTPSEIMLQWSDGTSWDHRAYWGANNIVAGTDGTDSRRYIGPLPATGQWVRLNITANQVGLEGRLVSGMSFAQYGGRATWDRAGKTTPASTVTNLALNKPATQSSTFSGITVASRATDGNVSGNWNDNSVASTDPENQAWWQVDLQSVEPIESIKVWNRTDCCSDRLANFYVFVSEQPFASNDVTATQNQAGVSSYHTTGQAGTPTTVTINRSGRYVRVQLAGSNFLSLAEVQVIQMPQTNLALNKSATQSSTFSGITVAGRATDGNISGNWNDNSVASTDAESQAWWQVDTGSVQSVQAIKVWNRTDCCSDRLSNFYVFISDQPFTSTNLAVTQAQAGVTSYYTAGTGGTPTTINVSRSGRYVRVQLSGNNHLSLAEVQVLGLAIPLPANNPPAVSITSPANSASFATPANITINANASDGDGSISKVEFFQGMTKLGEDTGSPYSFIWNNVALGSYALTAVAKDNLGVTSASSVVNISVTQPPSTVSGTVTKAGGTTAISGVTVKAMQGAATSGTATTNSNGDYAVTGLAAGTYTIEVTASGFGNKTQSAVTLATGATQTLNFSLDAIEAGPFEYIYDEVGRLISVVGPTETVVYSYDPVGNLLSISRRSSASVSITSFTPGSGAVGASVTINGTGFSTTASQNAVSFNGVSAAITSATSTRLVATVAPSTMTGTISVTTPAGSATSSTPFNITSGASETPTISSFTPLIATRETAVSVSGTNFETVAADNKVAIQGIRVPVTSSTATNLNVSVPLGATSGHLGVTTPAGRAESSGFLFMPPLTGCTEADPAPPCAVADVDFTSGIAFGETKVVTISVPNKIGLLAFDGTAGQKISLKISNPSYGMEGSKISINKPDGAALVAPLVINNSYEWFIDAQTLPSTGTYTIVVDPQGASLTGNITLKLNNVVDVTNTIIPGGAAVTAVTNTPGQNVRLTFNRSTEQQRISLLLNASMANGNGIAVSIYKPNGQALVSTTSMPASGGYIDVQSLPDPGQYTILINPFITNIGSMTVSLYDVVDVNGTITPDGTQTPFAITTPGQNAHFTFTRPSSQRISLRLINLSANMDFSLISISKPDGSPLVSPSALYNTYEWFIDAKALADTGSYTIVLDPQEAQTGSGTMLLYEVPDNAATTITPGNPATNLSTTVPGQKAEATFNGVVGQTFTFTLGANSVHNDNILVTVYKPNGEVFVNTTAFGLTGGSMSIPSLPVDGVYKILIDPYGIKYGPMTVGLTAP
jgi:YD repeat-containing protein